MITYYNKIEFNFDFDQDVFYFYKIMPHENIENSKCFIFQMMTCSTLVIYCKMLNVVFYIGWMCPDKG